MSVAHFQNREQDFDQEDSNRFKSASDSNQAFLKECEGSSQESEAETIQRRSSETSGRRAQAAKSAEFLNDCDQWCARPGDVHIAVEKHQSVGKTTLDSLWYGSYLYQLYIYISNYGKTYSLWIIAP